MKTTLSCHTFDSGSNRRCLPSSVGTLVAVLLISIAVAVGVAFRYRESIETILKRRRRRCNTQDVVRCQDSNGTNPESRNSLICLGPDYPTPKPVPR